MLPFQYFPFLRGLGKNKGRVDKRIALFGDIVFWVILVGTIAGIAYAFYKG